MAAKAKKQPPWLKKGEMPMDDRDMPMKKGGKKSPPAKGGKKGC